MRDRTAVALMAAGVLGAAVFTDQAAANVGLVVSCPSPGTAQARVDLTDFVPGRSISGSLLVALDGQTVHVGSHVFTGPASSVPVVLPRPTGHLVAAYGVGAESWSASADVNCVGPPALPTPPAPVSPPEPAALAPRTPAAEPPAARPATDCATLGRVGAGRRWLVRFGCVRPQPRITCAELRRRKAGPRWYWRLRCPMPLPPRPPARHVPVTG